MPAESRLFPQDFLWGAATSAYQVEGSPTADGAGPSNWHVFAHTPGKIKGGHTGDVACDHYRRFTEDVALMRQLGLTAYRFSIAWARILPEGRGRVNPRGLSFYQRLVDELLAAGITPMVTLFHWDLPWELARQGGWANRSTVEAFAEYAEVVFRALRDRVRLWATLNEPWVVMDAGYVHGVHPPGLRDPQTAAWVAHNLLLAHARAAKRARALGAGQVGWVVNLEPKYPATPRKEDVDATHRAHVYMNQLFVEPVIYGRYPQEVSQIFGKAWPHPPEEELSALPGLVDFLGVNYYTRSLNVADPQGPPPQARRLPAPADRCTTMGWEIYPEGLFEVLHGLAQTYPRRPLYVTENGAAFADPPPQGGRVADPQRVSFLRAHLQQLRRCLEAGIDLRGYFVWSLLDNFEWTEGFTQRFGIVYVDFESQKRTIKDSGWFYREVIASKGAILGQSHGFPPNG